MKEFDNKPVFLGRDLGSDQEMFIGSFARSVASMCEDSEVIRQSALTAYLDAVRLAENHGRCSALAPEDIKRFCQSWGVEAEAVLYPRPAPDHIVLWLQVKSDPNNVIFKRQLVFEPSPIFDSKLGGVSLDNYQPLGSLDVLQHCQN